MSQLPGDLDTVTHRRAAVDLFNFVWTLLDKSERSSDEIDAMINAAHASCYHWSRCGEPVNQARGHWQISRVYAVLHRGEPALWHATRSLAICQEHGLDDFDLAFAHEALARAAAVGGDVGGREKHLDLARRAAEAIAEQDDREVLLADLATVPEVG